MNTARPNRHVMRSMSGYIATAIAAALGLFLLGDAVLRAGWAQTMLWAPWVLLVVWAVYVGMAASTIATDDDAVDVQNLLRRHHIPWGSVTDIDLRYQLVLQLRDDKPVTCMGGPALARRGQQVTKLGQSRADAAEATLQGLRGRWSASRHRAEAQGAVTHTWDWFLVGSFVVLVVWALVALMQS
ncbi:PH domain-containing protein [Microbacterium sp. GXS0129]|uniref:PH domain-containing protein n=1 Tax=Microbacterium sp. GXS0129 TaxID=3377836 RepID=UPI00383A5A6F